MNIAPECYHCIYTQTLNITKKLSLNKEDSAYILREVAKILSKYDLNVTPPEIAAEVYEFISGYTKIKDPFKKEKVFSINEALRFKPFLEEKTKTLFDALKVAVAGNVIDFGVNVEFDIQKEVENIFELKFAYNDFKDFELELKNTKTVFYLADNAGENVFDEILVKTIKKLYPQIKIYYAVRGRPIINDVTEEDLKGLEICEIAEVINSGVNTPCFNLKKADKKALELFESCDVVLSKGMGNFECLFEEAKREVFFLFKVKCPVVAEAVGAKIGEYVFKKSGGINE